MALPLDEYMKALRAELEENSSTELVLHVLEAVGLLTERLRAPRDGMTPEQLDDIESAEKAMNTLSAALRGLQTTIRSDRVM